MRCVSFLFVLLTYACIDVEAQEAAVSDNAQHKFETWWRLSTEVLDIIAGAKGCGPMSRIYWLCAPTDFDVISTDEAKLAGACRGRPIRLLKDKIRGTEVGVDRAQVANFLRRALKKIGAEYDRKSISRRRLIRAAHMIDQSLRQLSLPEELGDNEFGTYSKWVMICAHARYSVTLIKKYISSVPLTDIESDQRLATSLWLLAQHTDFNPIFQKFMSNYFGQSEKQFMKRHSAMLIDRYKVNSNQMQIYATQINCKNGKYIPFPTVDFGNVDGRRKMVGMNSFEEYFKRYKGRTCEG